MSLTITELQSIVPVVFSDHPHPAVSDRYEFIPTLPIVEDLVSKGWQIRSAHQNKKNDPYAMHRIVFDVPGAPRSYAVGDVHPTCTLYNSLNRTRRLSWCIGFFKTVCSNQAQVMILGQSTSRIHIQGWGGTTYQATFDEMAQSMGDMITHFNRMRNTILTGDVRELFAREALSIKRYNDRSFAHLFDRSAAVEATTPRRVEDRSLDLFTTFNVVQENLLSRINEVSHNQTSNLGLWELAKLYEN